jgi:phosphonopyruvate decarboxylase
LYNLADRAKNFYLVGSMGMAAPIGLGISLARTDKQVVVLDGDGSFSMNLSVLPMIGQQQPRLLHVVLDNGSHESTGGQRPSALGDPSTFALAAGYRAAMVIRHVTEIENAQLPEKPVLMHIPCAKRGATPGGRVALTPPELVSRFTAIM